MEDRLALQSLFFGVVSRRFAVSSTFTKNEASTVCQVAQVSLVCDFRDSVVVSILSRPQPVSLGARLSSFRMAEVAICSTMDLIPL